MGKKQICILMVLTVLIISIIGPFSKVAYGSTVQETGTSEGEESGDTEEVEISESNETDSMWPIGPAIESASGVVMDFETGTIVYEKAGKEAHYPASITKVMTALVALENSRLDEKVTFSYKAIHTIEKGSSSIARDVDEVMTMEECIYGLLLESANECGNAIAEHVGGSVEGFVDMMNKKAKELGCVNTHFANPHGLHDPDHYTCAYDMALISRAAYKNPSFALITGTKSYTIPPTNKHEDPTYLNNHHAMLNYYRTNQYLYDYCVGGKTGYTSDALGTLVTYAKKDGITLICVTMCGAGQVYYTDTRALYDFYFNNLSTAGINELGEGIIRINENTVSRLIGSDEIPLEVDTGSSLLLPVGADMSQVTADFEKQKPDDDENSLGAIVFSYGNKVIGRAPIYGKKVEIYPFKNITVEGETEETEDNYIVINVYRIILIIVGVIIGIVLIVLLILRTNNTIATVRRKRIENRDPHKNMRRINRRRSRRKN